MTVAVPRTDDSGAPPPTSQQRRKEAVWSGFLAGAIPTVILQPLDVVRIRFQSIHGAELRQKGTLRALQHVFQTEGAAGLYRGLSPSLVGNTISWGVYLYLFQVSKIWTQKVLPHPHPALVSFLAGTQAGVMTSFLTNPIWLVKTRMQLQQRDLAGMKSLSSSASSGVSVLEEKYRYRNMLDALAKIYRYEGVRGLYTGLVPALFLVSHGSIQFMVYDEINRRHNSKTFMSKFLAAVISKTIAMGTTYPFQVVKTRLQDARNAQDKTYRGPVDAFQKMLRREGYLCMYRGFSPSLIRLLPSSAMTILLYEVFKAHGI